MRRFARTTVLASTAVFAAAVGAVALAPIASAEPEPTAPEFGSSVAESTDLVVTLGTKCVDKDDKKPEDGKVVALLVKVKNAGASDAANVSVNYGAIPAPAGAVTEDKIEKGDEIEAIVPSSDVEWVSRPAGAVAFSPQIDANYADNVKVEFLTLDCSPAEPTEGDE